MNSHEADLSPPPTPGPSSFAPRPMQSSKPSRAPARSLSLRIPEDGQAFGGLTQPSLASALPRSPVLHTSAPHIILPSANNQAGPSTLAPPPQSRLSRKRPSRLNLAPPSQSADESGQSSRSMPSSPVTLSRSPSHAEQAETTAPPASAISEAVKHLSSTLRGTPRRRPSMPFKPATAQETAYPEPPSAASSRSRPPEAFRDPSEHILSGKGSTLQHARSVYSHGPVEVLPGLFLGDEHNARDSDTLSALGITTILNVAKETVLDFQTECGSSSVYPSAAHPTWSNNAMSRQHVASNAGYQEPPTPSTYFTPPASASLSRPKAPGEASSPRDAISVSVLRNTSSTPNLLTHFVNGEFTGPPESAALHATEADSISTSDLRTLTAQDVLRYRSLRRTSDSSSDDAFGTASSPSSSRAASTCTSAATELTPPALMQLKHNEDAETNDNASSTYAFDDDSQNSPCAWFTKVELPSNATVITVPASIEYGRTHQIRYVKLPWTHDETDLASARGGFAQGIALIAEALGIDDRFWYAAKIAEDGGACAALQDDSVSLQHIQTDPSPGKILVHCQCGVSRSATLVIAFVMQAAAMRYGFEAARSLLGMHDCYNMVKEKSSSISPNISLIYQLVEWERHLSSSAGRLRDALGMGSMGNGGEVDGHTNANGHSSLAAAGWSTEPMDEAMWSKMRLEEEEKEAVEEERRRQERLDEAVRLAAERRAAQDRLEGRVPVEGAVEGSDTGSGSLMQRRRKNRVPTLQLQTSATPAVLGAPPAVAPVPSPGLQRRRPPALQLNSATRAGAGDIGRSEVETPFHTARLEAWTGHEQDADGDVTMNEPEPPQTPLRSSAADYDTASTPTARTTAAAYGGDSTSSALRTPNASSTWAPSPKTLVHSSSKEDVPSSELSAVLLPGASRRASTHGSIPTTLVSPSSPAMAPSLSMGSRPNRFSFGGAPLSGSLTAQLAGDLERTTGSRSRPDSMQSTMSSSSSSTALFGVTALSREERKKQHRRTFSSDWPTLQANLLSQRRRSKVDMLVPPEIEADALTTNVEHSQDAMDV